MSTLRTTYIIDFFYNNHTEDDFFRDKFFYLKLHALFNCLTESEIKTLYLTKSAHGENLKHTLLNFIERKSQQKLIDFSLIANELLEDYNDQSYFVQLSYRTFLSKIIKHLDKEIISNYFHLFIKSERVNDRKKSYDVAEILWPDVEDIIWENYFKQKDKEALIQILHYSTPADIVSNLSKIWEKDYPENKLKKLIIDKTHKESLSNFEFLNKSEPTFYLQALIARNMPIDKSLLKSLTKRMKKENNGFLFYYLGLAKDWDLLVDAIITLRTERYE